MLALLFLEEPELPCDVPWRVYQRNADASHLFPSSPPGETFIKGVQHGLVASLLVYGIEFYSIEFPMDGCATIKVSWIVRCGSNEKRRVPRGHGNAMQPADVTGNSHGAGRRATALRLPPGAAGALDLGGDAPVPLLSPFSVHARAATIRRTAPVVASSASAYALLVSDP